MTDKRLQTKSEVIPNSKEERLLKYAVHRDANRILKHHLNNENYMAAYIVAFSSLEDRLRAFYVVYLRDIKKMENYSEQVNKAITGIIFTLKDENLIERELAHLIATLADKRNKLLHEAMWRLDSFNMDIVTEALSVRNEIAKRLEKKKSELKKLSSK